MKPDEFGCLEWTGRRDKDGYGLNDGKRVHIAAWEAQYGPVPDGKVLDHLCAFRACCRLVHLEPVTQRENSFRKQWRYRSRIEQCQHGHDMRLHSVVTPNRSGGNGRVCRVCNREGL